MTKTEKQSLLNIVISHLLIQRCGSLRVNHNNILVPAYRGLCNTRCAIGVLIRDSDYSPTFEGMGIVQHYLENDPFNDARDSVVDAINRSYPFVRNVPEDRAFLRDLQALHDYRAGLVGEQFVLTLNASIITLCDRYMLQYPKD